jgi:hypothetical protein
VFREQTADLVLLGVSYDPSDTRQRGQIAGAALGVAAGDEDTSVLVLPVDAADGLPEFGIRSSRHRATVEDDHVGMPVVVDRLEASLGQLLRNGGGVSLVGAASEMDCVKPGHGIPADASRRTGN